MEHMESLEQTIAAERQILASMSVLMKTRLNELSPAGGDPDVAEGVRALRELLERSSALEAQMEGKDALTGTLLRLLAEEPASSVGALQKAAEQRGELESALARLDAALPAERREWRVSSSPSRGREPQPAPLPPGAVEELRGVRGAMTSLLDAAARSEQRVADGYGSQLRRATTAFSAERTRLEKRATELQARAPHACQCFVSSPHPPPPTRRASLPWSRSPIACPR